MPRCHRPRVLPAVSALGFACVLLSACAASGHASKSPAFGGRWIDLTHTFDEHTVVWPTSERFEHELLVGPAAVVDVRASASADPDTEVTIADLQAWEAQHGRLPDGCILLLHTGFASRWPDAASYLGTAERGEAAVAKLHFPGLHPDAAAWLVAQRSVHAVGLDTASIDTGQSTQYGSHVTLFEADIPAFENVADLSALPPVGAFIVALPMKIGHGTGGPLRIVAWLPE